jgi:hypothetical protein
MLPRTVFIILAGILTLLGIFGLYVYSITKKTSEGFADQASDLPAGWSVGNDPNDGTPYYFTSSGITQWEKPTAPAPSDAGQSETGQSDAGQSEMGQSETGQSDLPAGWSVGNDPNDGTPYYFTSSGITQWEKPTAPAPNDAGQSDAVQSDAGQSDLPAGWSVGNDPNDGTPYYFTSSGLTQWEKPISPPPAETMPQESEITPASQNIGPTQVPQSNDPSLLTNAVPGATTSNSNETLASFADLGALMEAIKSFKTYYDLNIITASKDPRMFDLNNNAVGHMIAIQDEMATGIIIDNYNYITDLRIIYENAAKELKQMTRKDETQIEDKELSSSSNIKIQDIEIVIERADEEHKLLTALRSEDAVTKKRLANLLKIISDMKDLIDRIKRGKMDIKDAPFSKNDLRVLYTDIRNKKKSDVKSITTPEVNNMVSNKKASVASVLPSAAASGLNLDKNYGELLGSLLKDMSWDIRIGYDPDVTLKRNMLDRMDAIKEDLKTGKLNEAQIKDKLVELGYIKQQYSSGSRRTITGSKNNLKPYNKSDYARAEEGYQPTPVEFTNGRRIKQPTSFDESESQDWQLRPGYKMTSDKIKTRGSDSSFDPTKVGGPDYFKRAQFLCNQINDAGLGDPNEFGCIDSRTVVSPEYSWKGNYLMVCSRLGNIWGGWYPEMFGCPPLEKSELQMPNKKIDRV